MEIVPPLFKGLFLTSFLICAQAQEYHVFSIAFYNLENLFDTKDNPDTFDDDYTLEGKLHWTLELYDQKIQHLADVIAQIGFRETQNAPIIVGVAEVENRDVLEDLVRRPGLKPFDYGVVHYESPDTRGMDVALLYQRRFFIVDFSKTYRLKLVDPKSQRKITTRDQLVVSGFLNGENICFLVNHWPSRRGGEKASRPHRIAASRLQQRIIDSLQRKNSCSKIISMGDFNDNPTDESLQLLSSLTNSKYLESFHPLVNPMEKLYKKGVGSLAYKDRWHLFDQILFSKTWKKRDGFFYLGAKIFNPSFLQTPEGHYRGYPFRSKIRGKVLSGFSDHFPVYMLVGKQINRTSK